MYQLMMERDCLPVSFLVTSRLCATGALFGCWSFERCRVAGELFVVSTPIGNLDDMTFRAVRVLQTVDLVLAEDTRHTGRLLAHIQSTVPQLSLHEHNEEGRITKVIADLQAGKQVALVSDAGTPLISDPGYRLVSAAVAAEIRVTPIPGASSVMAAAVVSGLPMDRFAFEGFLPRRGAARTQRLKAIAADPRTTVLFASPHHLHADLDALVQVCGAQREAVLCRELTKRFEEVRRGTLLSLSASVVDGVKGECVVVLHGVVATEREPVSDEQIVQRVAEQMQDGTSKRDAIGQVAKEFAMSKRTVYQLVMSTKT